MHVQILGMAIVCKSEHQGFKKAKETVQVWGQRLRYYAKEQLRENMGHSKSKKRGFKEQQSKV
jgi:hypothetical protein